MSQLTDKDLEYFANKGIEKNKVRGQIRTFKEGIPFVNLEKAAIIGNGILKFTEEKEKQLIKSFEEQASGKSLLKFVPASGAASRMFKALFNFLDSYNPGEETLDVYLNRTNDKNVKFFAENMEQLPFYKMVYDRIAGKALSKDGEVFLFVKEMLFDSALNYGFFPKGLLPFHNYNGKMVTPFEEHLKEGAKYANQNGKADIHFTISEQHEDMFKNELLRINSTVSLETGTSYTVNYSFQKPSTDTIAVDMNNKPFRNSDGTILFRPGGHGALIENLNEQDADIIFIKNIDNVVVSKYADEVANSKKILAGILLEVQKQTFEYAALIDNTSISEKTTSEIKQFLEEKLNARFLDKFVTYSLDEKIRVLKDKLNRPIRICGMVKNEGEPGGGPFWVEDKQGRVSLQIIESAQIDLNNKKQKEILQNSTHFNPVDIVCGIKNYKGEKYNILNFVDSKQGFITEKTKDGKVLKALELPGLWNGAMAFWNTIFVEVPLITFNPVKTVNDLLKPSHQQ